MYQTHHVSVYTVHMMVHMKFQIQERCGLDQESLTFKCPTHFQTLSTIGNSIFLVVLSHDTNLQAAVASPITLTLSCFVTYEVLSLFNSFSGRVTSATLTITDTKALGASCNMYLILPASMLVASTISSNHLKLSRSFVCICVALSHRRIHGSGSTAWDRIQPISHLISNLLIKVLVTTTHF